MDQMVYHPFHITSHVPATASNMAPFGNPVPSMMESDPIKLGRVALLEPLGIDSSKPINGWPQQVLWPPAQRHPSLILPTVGESYNTCMRLYCERLCSVGQQRYTGSAIQPLRHTHSGTWPLVTTHPYRYRISTYLAHPYIGLPPYHVWINPPHFSYELSHRIRDYALVGYISSREKQLYICVDPPAAINQRSLKSGSSMVHVCLNINDYHLRSHFAAALRALWKIFLIKWVLVNIWICLFLFKHLFHCPMTSTEQQEKKHIKENCVFAATTGKIYVITPQV